MTDLPTGTITLLFTDVEDSTQLLQRFGPHYGDVLAEYRTLLRSIFQAHGGQEVDTQGDSFFVAFPRALDAVQAAMEIQRALAEHIWPEGVVMATRMGLHTGEPQRGSEGYSGLDVHRAARIGAAGHGGQVLLSQTTRDLAAHELPTGAALLGIAGPSHAAADDSRTNVYLPLISGNRSMLILDVWRGARACQPDTRAGRLATRFSEQMSSHGLDANA